eukprot:TRINITY_DN6980_c0_g2_i1.p1 TRINITY_DN6980_c0_g2~~TRINITY_DN6980_c0_g2_i1.p1  ORF type:complete len:535 (+),score=177.16 TRINITY_DN6980_c0_g2_i1:216-1607(+)
MANIGFLSKHFVKTGDPRVDKDRWVDMDTFLELQALANALPGPTSTQLLCALAMLHGGWLAGVLSFICWNLPAAIAVTLVGSHIGEWLHGGTPPWLAGAKAAACALVCLAAWDFVKKTCFGTGGRSYNRVNCSLVALCACTVLICSDADVHDSHPYVTMWLYPLWLVVGGLVSWFCSGPVPSGHAATEQQRAVSRRISVMSVPAGVGGAVCGFTVALLALCFALPPSEAGLADCGTPCRGWNIFSAFWRMGATIYGGGQVVLPMTLSYVVNPGWVTADQFYQGLALIGMMPGPVFNFSAYMGAVYGAANPGGSTAGSVACTVLAWAGLFGPGLLLIFGVLPFWARARDSVAVQAALPGVTATAVGLVVGSCVILFEETVINPAGAAAFALTVCTMTFLWPEAAADFKHVQGPVAILCGAALGAALNLAAAGTALYADQYVCKDTGLVALPSGSSAEYHYCPAS